MDRLDLFPAEFRNEKSMAEAHIYEFSPFNKTRDSILFLDKRNIAYRDKRYTGYFFKARNNQDYDTNFKMYLVKL